MVPDCGVTLYASELEALWDRFSTAAPPRQRRSVRCPAGDCAAIAEKGALQRSEERLRALARRYSISPTTVQKWRKREVVTDRPMGPTEPHSSVLSIEQEAVIVAFRRHSLLPLDDCLYARDPASDAVVLAPCVGENDPQDRFLTLLTFNGTRYHGCPILKAICPPRRSSRPIRSGFSTSAARQWFACKP